MAKTKVAKKKATKITLPRVHRITFSANKTFHPTRIKMNHADFLWVFTPADKSLDVQIKVLNVSPSGGSGGPIIIHS